MVLKTDEEKFNELNKRLNKREKFDLEVMYNKLKEFGERFDKIDNFDMEFTDSSKGTLMERLFKFWEDYQKLASKVEKLESFHEECKHDWVSLSGDFWKCYGCDTMVTEKPKEDKPTNEINCRKCFPYKCICKEKPKDSELKRLGDIEWDDLVRKSRKLEEEIESLKNSVKAWKSKCLQTVPVIDKQQKEIDRLKSKLPDGFNPDQFPNFAKIIDKKDEEIERLKEPCSQCNDNNQEPERCLAGYEEEIEKQKQKVEDLNNLMLHGSSYCRSLIETTINELKSYINIQQAQIDRKTAKGEDLSEPAFTHLELISIYEFLIGVLEGNPEMVK